MFVPIDRTSHLSDNLRAKKLTKMAENEHDPPAGPLEQVLLENIEAGFQKRAQGNNERGH